MEVALQSADLSEFEGAARAGGGDRPGRRPVRILSVGRLVPDKDLDVLIDAFAEAGFADGEAELEIRGGGPLEAELREQAERLNVPVRFPGPANPGELGGIYAAADVLALVSSYEPFGVTLREGAAAGLPLIASRRAGAVGDVAVEGENALVVDPGDRGQIAAALRRLVREPDLRERLAAGSRAVTARHPLEADVEAWERAVLRAVAGPRTTALSEGCVSIYYPLCGTRSTARPLPRRAGSSSLVTVSWTASERKGRISSAACSR